jgi:DNA-binding CsgD family transcriptional regulator/tetratricopeptide (TPR) repeat protein
MSAKVRQLHSAAGSARDALLSTDAQQLAEIVAVLGDSFSVDDAGVVLGEPVGRVLPWIRELLDAQVIRAEGTLFVFVDGDDRERRYSSVPEPVRLALHRQIGRMLLDRGGSAVPAARHLAIAARPGDRDALTALDRVTQEIMSATPRRAAEFALRALELTEPNDATRFTRSVTAVNALIAARQLGEGLALARFVLAAAPPATCEAELRLTLSSALFAYGRLAESAAEAEAVLARPDLPEAYYSVAVVSRLLALLAEDDFSRAREPAEGVIAGDVRGASDDALASALTALALITWSEGRVADSLGLMRAAVHRSDRGQIETRRVNPRLPLALMFATLGEFEEAETCIDESERAIAGADGPAAGIAAVARSRVLLEASRLHDAVREPRDLEEAGGEPGAWIFVPVAYATLAAAALLRGDLAAAARYVAQYRAQRSPPPANLGSDTCTWVEAQLGDAEGSPRRAFKVLAPVYADMAAHKRLLLEEPGAAAWLVRTALAVGERQCAAVAATHAERLAEDNRLFPHLGASAVHARALMDEDAAGLRWAATEHWHPWARASAAEDAGVLLARTGKPATAREMLEQALGDYERAGALRDCLRVRRRLAAPGTRPRHRSRRRESPVEGWDSLTEGERRVVELVAQGLTNRQVAERAYLSRHTVDFHLRQAFRKLNVSSRVELARIAIEHQR